MNIQKYDKTSYLLFRLLNEHVKQERKKLSIIVLCMIITALTTALSAWLIQPVLDDIFLKKDVTMLYVISIAILVNTLIKATASFYESFLLQRVGQSIVADIQLRLYTHLIHADMDFLNTHSSGNLISRFTNDINEMRNSVSRILTGLTQEVMTLVGLVAIMFYQRADLASIALCVLPLAFYLIFRLGKRVRKISQSMQEEMGWFTKHLSETFQNARIIKSYCREDYEISRIKIIIGRFINLYKKSVRIKSVSSPIMEVLGSVAITMVIWYGGSQVTSGYTTPGTFFSFITALLMAYKPLKAIANFNTHLQDGLAASRRLFIILDEKPKIISDNGKVECDFNNNNIELCGVHFSYKDGQKILDGINMHIPEGKTVALVGGSGVGKSTVLNLLQRLYDPDSGEIMIGGYNITDIKLKSLRKKMALVSQEVVLFDDTIAENIRYGRLNATDEEIVDAALAAAAHEFITSFPKGYETTIGESGVKLSGGQKQRIAIARAILKNAPILLLDEATSALDSISEKQVQMALEFLKKNRTTIVIAHRLSTIQSADIIYVISEGQILEHGTHQELLENGKEYQKLYEHYKESMNDGLQL